MNSKAFYDAVVRMRTAQKEYFKYRRPSDLQRSKQYEKVVDDEIARVERILLERHPPLIIPQ
jgi:hypothetical protein